MKLLTGGFLVSLFIFLFLLSGNTQAQTASNIWDGTVTTTETGDISLQTILGRPDCEFKNVKVVKPSPPFAVVFGSPLFLNPDYVDMGSSCVISNSQGSFAAQNFSGNNPTQRISYYSGNDNLSKMYSLANSNSSVFLDPAPAGNNVLMISGISGANYRLTLIKNFVDESRLSTGGQFNVEWRFETVEENFKTASGSHFLFSKHAFSSNGRYLAVRYNNVLGKIDLQTMVLTPIEWRSSWPASTEIAISNNGRNIAVLGNGLHIFDTSTCETNYSYGEWVNANTTTYPGCIKSRNFQPELIVAVPAGYDFVYRPHFALNSASLNVAVGKRVVNSNDLLPQRFTWKEFNIKADSYVSQVDGYIALGDSFSSGEGDLEGGTWYEPGTDEQGNKDTFEGRNLCHLSRRSYPYLIAKELGYLSGSPDQPITPPVDGLFHSVACSGAKIHNIFGTELGPRLGPGNEENFEIRENQYRNDYYGSLGAWQPGRIKQLDFFAEDNSAVYRDLQNPSVITIGIGGNDGGFGDIIQACVAPGTCKQAISGTEEAGSLATGIALIKSRLVDTYKAVKDDRSEARVYVHGYPKFVQVGGNCALNVHLDAQEIVMADEGVKYMNAVVKAAALEAGVFYVDVEDILLNRNLCSLAPQDQKAFNGVTAGNDISNLIFNIGSHGICFIRSGCLGKETFHPNKMGHQLYKQAIATQTNNLQTVMPGALKQPYPLPSDFFGYNAQSTILEWNENEGSVYESSFSIPQPLISLGQSSDILLSKSELLPGSTAEIVMYSDPVLIGSYQVPQNGEISIEFDIPDDIPSGIHEIHLKGTDKFGEIFDYHEPIIISESISDFDGDGIENHLDKCPTVKNSNIDIDRDGIDDVCDAEAIPYVEPPVDPPAEPKPNVIQKIVSLIKKIVKVLVALFR